MGGYEVLASALSTSNIGQLYKITEHDIMRNILVRTNENIAYLLLKVMHYNLCTSIATSHDFNGLLRTEAEHQPSAEQQT
jgi:hypothetical protein